MKIECLDANVAAVRPPDSAERAVLGSGDDFGLTFCWPMQAAFVIEEPLCDVGTPS